MPQSEYDHENARKAQNDSLKLHGYEWRKRSMRLGNGRLVERWFLIDPDGKAVAGFKDGGGGRTSRFGNVNAILEKLGYYKGGESNSS